MRKTLSLLVTTLFFNMSVQAATLKIGVVAPDGTSWAKNMKAMAKEVKEKTDGRVKLRVYFGGSQGDEPDVLRKIRVGQLQGGVFTGKTLGEINGDVRVVEIPFTFFDDNKKALNTLTKMAPYFDKKFEAQGFKNLGFIELGNVYFISQKKTESLDSLKGVKIWTWEGDELVNAMITSLNLVSVPLALPDVLSSLSTGVVEAAYAPALGIVALQWNSKVKYLVDFPLAYSTGAFLVSEKAWKKIKPNDQKTVQKIADEFMKKINAGNEKDNQEALTVMKQLGNMEYIKFNEADLQKAGEIREDIVKQLKGKLFSDEAYQLLEKNRK